MEEQEFDLRVVSLRDLWEVLKRRFVLILLASVLVASGAFAFTHVQVNFSPRYESTATLYILRQGGEDINSSAEAYNDFSLALRLVNDCEYIIKSHSTLDPVIENLGLDLTYEELYANISVGNPDDTRILAVTVEADTPEEAKRIVDEVCETGAVQIEKAMGYEQVRLFESGVLEDEPCNAKSLSMFVILGLLSALVVYTFYLVAFLLDDRIRTDEDIERVLGLSILGDIPNANKPGKGYGYGGYYGRKKYGYGYGPSTVRASAPLPIAAPEPAKQPVSMTQTSRPAQGPRRAAAQNVTRSGRSVGQGGPTSAQTTTPSTRPEDERGQ